MTVVVEVFDNRASHVFLLHRRPCNTSFQAGTALIHHSSFIHLQLLLVHPASSMPCLYPTGSSYVATSRLRALGLDLERRRGHLGARRFNGSIDAQATERASDHTAGEVEMLFFAQQPASQRCIRKKGEEVGNM